MLTEDPLEDRDARAFFKGRTAVVAPFLMTLLRDVVTSFAAFATPFTDDTESVECVDGEDRDGRRYDEDRDTTEFSRFIV
jgi:hypothetical protein